MSNCSTLTATPIKQFHSASTGQCLLHVSNEIISSKGHYGSAYFPTQSQSQDPNMPQFGETHQILLYATTAHDSLLLLSISQRQGM